MSLTKDLLQISFHHLHGRHPHKYFYRTSLEDTHGETHTHTCIYIYIYIFTHAYTHTYTYILCHLHETSWAPNDFYAHLFEAELWPRRMWICHVWWRDRWDLVREKRVWNMWFCSGMGISLVSSRGSLIRSLVHSHIRSCQRRKHVFNRHTR